MKNEYTVYFGTSRIQSLVRPDKALFLFNGDDAIESNIMWTEPNRVTEIIYPTTSLRLHIGKVQGACVIESYDDILEILPTWVVIYCVETMSCINRIFQKQAAVSPDRNVDPFTLN